MGKGDYILPSGIRSSLNPPVDHAGGMEGNKGMGKSRGKEGILKAGSSLQIRDGLRDHNRERAKVVGEPRIHKPDVSAGSSGERKGKEGQKRGIC